MTEPHTPTERAGEPDEPDEPLTEAEDHVLDLVDEAPGRDELDSDPATAAALEAQVRARDAVAAAVDVPELVRQRALRAALAEHRRPADEMSIERAPIGAGRSRPRFTRWALQAVGAVAALALVVGVVAVVARGGSRTESTTAAGSATEDMALPATAAPVAGTDFGVAANPDELVANVARVAGLPANETLDGKRVTESAANATAAPTMTPSAPPTPNAGPASGADGPAAAGGSGSGGAVSAYGPAGSCEAAARAGSPGLGAAMVLASGPVVYQGTAATVYVFGDVGGPVRELVAVSDDGCRVLVTAPI